MTQSTSDADRLKSAETEIEILWILIDGVVGDQEKMKEHLRRASSKGGISAAAVTEINRRLARVETEVYRRG